MFGNRPGQIRCPTCHRATPAGETCAKCGAPIPASALYRPRGMDRDELQARIRARRSGQPYRRGSTPPPPPPPPAEPERWRDPPDSDIEEAHRWAPPPQSGAIAGATSSAGAAQGARYVDPAYAEPASYGEPRFVDPINRDEQAWSGTDHDAESTRARYEPPGYTYSRREQRRARGAPFLVLGLVVLGAMALLGGAALAGVITRRSDTAIGNGATPTPAATVISTPIATASPPPVATPSGTPGGTETPRFFFADGFSAEAEPCLVQPTQPSCPAPGAVVPASNGTIWILVTFEQIRGGDLIGVHGVGPDGRQIGDASWQAPGGASSPPANGHAYFGFSLPGLPEGEYEVTVTRNGDDAAVTTFRIEG